MRAWLSAVALAAACGNGSMMNPVDGSGSPDGSDAGSDAVIPPGWDMLISRPWSLPTAGSEAFKCVRIQVPQDMWISGFKALAPTGTHHSLLTIDPDTTQTGEFNCDPAVGFNGTSTRLLYASGLNTNELMFPQGTAVHIPAGAYITLNLHLLASGDFGIHDTSGVLVKTVDHSQVVHEIDATLAGAKRIDFPADGQDHLVTGGCAAPNTWHVFALWPHMHESGVHSKLIFTENNVSNTVLDEPFDFSAEQVYPMSETVVNQGDLITVDCIYNAGMHTCDYANHGACVPGTCYPDNLCHIPYGESSAGEMCYVAMYKYPAGDAPVYGCGTE
jgi:hypothetical protein